MSFSMSLTDKDGGDVADMNWLRNPFGLRDWIRDNTHIDITPFFPTYDRSNAIDRKAALDIARNAQNMVVQLDMPFFKVRKMVQPLRGYDQDMRELVTSWPTEEDQWYILYLMPETASYKKHIPWHKGSLECHMGFAHYRKWVDELVAFCTLLQDEELTYYASD